MSSHLHRLAERALGQARPLRTLAQGPVRSAETPNEFVDTPAPVGRDETGPSAVVLARSAPTGHALSATQVANRRTEHLDVAAGPPPSSSDQHPNTPPPNDPVTRAGHATGLTRTATPDDLAPAPARREPTMLLPVTEVADGGLQMPFQPFQPPQPTQAQAQAQAQDQNLVDAPTNPPGTIRPDEPPALLPRVSMATGLPPLHLPSQGWAAQSEARQPASAAEETTEVHVSIGRIEVTAVQAPAGATPAAPRRRQAPMSLDDYIARRQGGRS